MAQGAPAPRPGDGGGRRAGGWGGRGGGGGGGGGGHPGPGRGRARPGGGGHKAEAGTQAAGCRQGAGQRRAGLPSARLHLLKTIALRQRGKTGQATSSRATGRELLLKHAPARADLLELAAQAGELVSEGR